MGILHSDPIFGFCVEQIKHRKKRPFQRLHQKPNGIGRIGRMDVFCDWISKTVVNAADDSVKTGNPLLKQLLESICYAKLTVDKNSVTVTLSCTNWFHDLSVTARSNRTKVVLIKIDVLGSDLLRERPIAGFRPCLDDAVRSLTKQHQYSNQDPQERQCTQKSQPGPIFGLYQEPIQLYQTVFLFRQGMRLTAPVKDNILHELDRDENQIQWIQAKQLVIRS